MRGLARWSAMTPVAANVIMFLLLLGGVMSAFHMRREMFPEFDLDLVSITVPYPGASPEEVEEGICIKVEEQIEGVEGIKRITSRASEGSGLILVELETGADVQQVYDDIKNEVDRIITFPEEAEEPVITNVAMRRDAVWVPVYGDTSDHVLKEIAQDVREDITRLPGISIANLMGARDYEISIELSEEKLRRYNLTFDEVSRIVAAESVDLPAGKIKSRQGEILVRAKGQKYHGEDYAAIPLLSRGDGSTLRLGEVAEVVDGFADTDVYARYNGKPAVMVQVMQTSSQDMIDVVDAVESYLEKKKPTLPSGVMLDTAFDSSVLVRDRIDLLVRNGLQGLVLVFLVLGFFLRWRLAFWVAMGIPISFMGGLIILNFQNATINMLSLFAFIMTLGIVVDDAIIVGENIHAHFRKNHSPLLAAIEGAGEVAWPVTISILTTVVAFCPMLFVTGIMGKFMSILPKAVIAVLLVSLFEAFLILPAHLKDSLQKAVHRGAMHEKPGWRHRLLEHVITRYYQPWLLKPALRYRYLTVAVALGLVIMSFGLVAGGRLPFIVFPKFDSNYIMATVQFPDGTPVTVTEAAIKQMEAGVSRVAGEWEADENGDKDVAKHQSLLRAKMAFVGQILDNRGPGSSGGNVGSIFIELLPTEKRNIASTEILNRWREYTGRIAGADMLSFSGGQAGPGGSPIEIQLLGKDLEMLKAASEALQQKLATYAGVYDIQDDFSPGKWEIKVRPKPEAKALGLDLGAIARQVRGGFYGAEAERIQRGRDELKVMVRYPETDRENRSQLEQMRVLLPSGARVPIHQVAELDFGRGYSTIRRAERQRAVTVTADLDETKANAREIIMELRFGSVAAEEKAVPFMGKVIKMLGFGQAEVKETPSSSFLTQLQEKYPGLSFSLEGQQKRTRESVGSLLIGFGYALVAIFCLLAAQFRSYIQPIIIMFAIPVGLTGAFVGHLLMGMPLTLISIFGIVALSGIVVNDSLVLIDFINRAIAQGMDPVQAVFQSGGARFRAIILTSTTTIAGLLPLLIERSMQAQFLLPMAVSLAFGLMSATVLTLLITPALYLIVADVKHKLGMRVAGRMEDEHEMLAEENGQEKDEEA